jgi:uncharacterized protein YjbJ (UPF0337 family)
MNEHQVKGRVEEAKGKVKEAAGRAVGNDRLRAKGEVEQVAGKTQATYGDAKERVKDALDDDRRIDRPLDRP